MLLPHCGTDACADQFCTVSIRNARLGSFVEVAELIQEPFRATLWRSEQPVPNGQQCQKHSNPNKAQDQERDGLACLVGLGG